MTEITQADQIDREAAAKFPYIPEHIALVQAFARHREQAEQATVAKIVAWLRDGGSWEKPVPSSIDDAYWDAAKDIEQGEWK